MSTDLEYITVAREPFVVIMPSDHRLTACERVDVRELVGELFIGGSNIAGPMRRAIEDYLAANNLDIDAAHRDHNLTMAMSLIASTRGVALLPSYAENFLPWSVTSRPLKGEAPTIDLVIGYARTNTSPTLALFLSRVDQIKKCAEDFMNAYRRCVTLTARAYTQSLCAPFNRRAGAPVSRLTRPLD